MTHAEITRVRITDVSPRDGLQNEPNPIPTADKVRLVRALCASGVDEIEVSSFVSPKWVPQLGDAREVFAELAGSGDDLSGTAPIFSALVPNEKGMSSAIEVNAAAGRPLIRKVSVFTAASETFCARNINTTIAQSVERFRPVVAAAGEHGLLLRAYISCAIACPFEGPIAPARVAEVIRLLAALQDAGPIHEIDLGDTIGAGTPQTTLDMIRAATDQARASLPNATITFHPHDTFGRAADCVRAALQSGVTSFDGSAAGLGGCPYAGTPDRRAPGNIDTLTLVKAVHAEGFATGVDLDRLEAAAAVARSLIHR